MCPHGFLLDQWYEQYLATHPIARWTLRFLSFLTMTIATIEMVQMTAMLVAFVTTLIFTWERIENLTSQLPTETGSQFASVVTNFRQLHVISKVGRDYLMCISLIMEFVVSVMASGLTYVTIKLYGKMPTVAWLMASYVVVVIFCVTYFLLRALEGVNTKCVEGLGNLRGARVRNTLERRMVNAVPVFAIPCGLPGYKLFQVEDGYKLDFYAKVLDNTWNLLLSFPNP